MENKLFNKLLIEFEKIKIINDKYEIYLEKFDRCFSKIINKSKKDRREEISKNNININANANANANNEDNKEEFDISENNINEIDKLTNKLKKLIAIKTHPDKVKGMEKIFKKSIKAYKNNNLFELLSLAIYLKIPIPNTFTEDIYEKSIENIRQYKKEILNSYAWVWFNDISRRKTIRKNLSKSWKVSEEIIEKIENEFNTM